MTFTRICPLLFGLLLAGGCRKAPAPLDTGDPKVAGETITFPAQSAQLATLTVEPATPAQPIARTFPGRVAWNESVTARIYSPLAGRVTRLLADVHSSVAAQTPLALIASPDYGQAQSDARRAAADLELAERNLARLRELHEHGAAPLKDLQGAEADAQRARAEDQRTEARLQLYGDLAGGIDQLYRLTSPIGGVVVERTLNPGQEVRPDTMLANSEKLAAPLFVVTDPTQVWIIVDVAEQDLSQFKPGLTVAVHSRAFPAESFAGAVESVADQIDPATRMVPVRVGVANPMQRLKADMLVSVEVTPPATAAVEVPTRAVYLKGEQHFAFREEGAGSFTRRPISVGPEHAGRIQIVQGLARGDRVVSDGSLLLEQILAGD